MACGLFTSAFILYGCFKPYTVLVNLHPAKCLLKRGIKIVDLVLLLIGYFK